MKSEDTQEETNPSKRAASSKRKSIGKDILVKRQKPGPLTRQQSSLSQPNIQPTDRSVRDSFENLNKNQSQTSKVENLNAPHLSPLSVHESYFNTTYKRPFVNTCIQIIEDNLHIQDALPYSAMVQSPLSGKSRLIQEIATTIPIVYVCFRPENSTGFPPRSGTSIDFLEALKQKTKDTQKRLKIFENSVYFAVEKLGHEIIKLSERPDRFKAIWDRQIEGKLSLFNKQSVSRRALTEKKKSKIWQSFLEAVNFEDNKKLNVIFAFDEARYLLHEESTIVEETSPENSLFRVIRQSLMNINIARSDSEKGLYGLFIDTLSKVSNFTPSEERDPSGNRCGRIFEPIFELNTFDVHLDDWPLDLDFNKDHLHFARIGRPGWILGDNYAQTVQLASQMLKGGKAELDECSKLAVIMSIFGVEMRENSVLAETLCSSHLAFLTFVSPSRVRVEIKFPSEPVVAHAAHVLLKTFKDKLFHFLTKFLSAGYITSGERGEIVAEISLLHCPTLKTPMDGFFGAQTNLVSLNDFFEAIGIKGAKAEESSELFYGKVHLSHWQRASSRLSPQCVIQSFYRSSGTICRRFEKSFDLLIPIFIATEKNYEAIRNLKKNAAQLTQSDLTDKEWSMIKKMFSFIAIQVKNYTCSTDRTAADPEAYVQEVSADIEEFSELPGYIMHLEMSGDHEDEVEKNLTSKKHCFIRRTGSRGWGFESNETELAQNILSYEVPEEPVEPLRRLKQNLSREFRASFAFPRSRDLVNTIFRFPDIFDKI